jgi:hypothetical protein
MFYDLNLRETQFFTDCLLEWCTVLKADSTGADYSMNASCHDASGLASPERAAWQDNNIWKGGTRSRRSLSSFLLQTSNAVRTCVCVLKQRLFCECKIVFLLIQKKNSFPDEKLAGFHLNETEFGKELASHAIRRQVD